MLISEEQIFLDVSLNSRDAALEFISSEAEKQKVVDDKAVVFQDFINRENEYSTAFQEGIAIPHAKSEIVNEAKLYFVRMQEKVEWYSPDGFKVKYIFAILVPEQDAGTKHIQILSNLAGNLLEEDFQKQIFQAENEAAVLTLLTNLEQE